MVDGSVVNANPAAYGAIHETLTTDEISRRRVEAITFCPMSDVLRNHLVTLAYVDLSNAMARLLGDEDANWCCLAVWPSYTVGASIRSSRLGRLKLLCSKLPLPRSVSRWLVASSASDAPDVKGVMNRSLAAGNRGVFYEVALAWIDFIETFGDEHPAAVDSEEFARFSERVLHLPTPPGQVWPEGNRQNLRDGFRAYLEALHTDDPRRRSQLILLGNIRIGDHEQRRLQGWLDLSTHDLMRKIIKPFDMDDKPGRLVKLLERGWAWLLTKKVFYVQMVDERIRVGHPIPPHPTTGGGPFPPPLTDLDPDVAEVFDRIDAAAPGGDGAERWTDIDHRMAFIVHLFRARQQAGLVGAQPYSEDAKAVILADAALVDRALDEPTVDDGLLFADLTKDLDRPWSAEVDADFNAHLERSRGDGDVEADAAMEAFYASSNRPPHERHYTDALMAAARRDPGGDGPLATFLAAPPELPEWADLEQIELAQAFYDELRTAAHIGLFFGSMPLSYAASKGCQVLGLVSTLSGDTVRRFWESTRFVEDIFTTRFWEADSDGYKSIRGVRLFHAAVRSTIESDSVHIIHRPNDDGKAWDSAWGRPINQEDLLAATIDWSVATIHVMDRFGVPLTEEQARAYYHTWLVVGYLLGVRGDLLMSPADPSRPLTLEESQYGARVMLFRQIGPTVAGRRLMAGLLGLIDEWFPQPFRKLPRAMMYAALNDEIAKVLGLPPPGRAERTLVKANEIGRSLRSNAVYSRVVRRLVRFVGDRWLDWWENEYQEVPPYRRGGTQAAAIRQPVSLKLTIELLGAIEDLPSKLGSIEGVEVTTVRKQVVSGQGPVVEAGADGEDDEDVVDVFGYPPPSNRVEVGLTCETESCLRETIREMRNSLSSADGVHYVELLIDGRPVPLAALTDAQIDALIGAQAAR